MFEEEMACCMGLISALHQFENKSESEFKKWAINAPLSIAKCFKYLEGIVQRSRIETNYGKFHCETFLKIKASQL
jgi:hypothetical protein